MADECSFLVTEDKWQTPHDAAEPQQREAWESQRVETKPTAHEGWAATKIRAKLKVKEQGSTVASHYIAFLYIFVFASYISILTGSTTNYIAIYLNNYSEAEQITMTNLKEYQLFWCDQNLPSPSFFWLETSSFWQGTHYLRLAGDDTITSVL